MFFKQPSEHYSYFANNLNARNCQLKIKELSKIKDLRLFEVRAVEIVAGCRVPGTGNENAYETFKITTAGKCVNLLKKLW